mgnify:CR=1 FL=1
MTQTTPYPARLAGLHTALMTPYDAAGEISAPCLQKLVDLTFRQGLDGLYVGGSTGESLLLSTDEREHLFALTAEAARGRGALLGHVGAISTREAVRLARCCAELKYDAVSAIPPIYFPHAKGAIFAYYRAIAEAAQGVPLVIYNIPGLSGVRFSLADFETLLAIPGVVGIKQTANDMYQMEQLRRTFPGMLLFNGFDEMMAAGLISGANGGIGSTYNIMGTRYVALRKAVAEGRNADALALQARCNAVIDVLVEVGVFQGLKYLLYRLGVLATPACRAPMETISGAAATKLDALLAELRAELPL